MAASPLEICVIDKTTGMLYEWNGNHTVNVFDANEYVKCMLNGETPKTYDVWVMSSCRGADDFVSSVIDHTTEGEEDETEGG